MTVAATPTTTLRFLPVAWLEEDPGQPRQTFEEEELERLIELVRTDGVITPLTVRPLGGDRYRVVHGARRRLAAIAVGLDFVPCLVEDEHTAIDYVTLRAQQAQSNVGVPLTELEQWQTFLNLYLAENVRALAAAAEVADPTTELIDAGLSPVDEQQRLEVCIADLSGSSVAEYLRSGVVKVSRASVARRLGLDLSERTIKRGLSMVRGIDSAVKAALLEAGADLPAKTLADLARKPAGEQAEAMEAAAATGGEDVGAALRRILNGADAPSHGLPGEEMPAPPVDTSGLLEILDPEAAAIAADGWSDADLGPDEPAAQSMPPTERPQRGGGADEPLPFPGANAAGMRTDGPVPGRGSVPPAGHDEWTDDLVGIFSGGLEALLTVLDDAGPRRLTDAQRRRLQSDWGELLERAQLAGLEVGDGRP